MNQILEIERLKKRYGSQQVLSDLSFTVMPGQICALLGPNGAGKTTCLEIIEGLRSPDSGTIRIAGIDAFRYPKKAQSIIGVQLQVQGLPPAMTVSESLGFIATWRKIKPNWPLAKEFGLDAMANKQFSSLSLGWQRRLMLALALTGNPQLIILDEPTAGLDLESRMVLHKAIQNLRSQGTSILMATHDMAEAEKLADNVVVLIGGTIAAQGSPRQLTTASRAPSRIMLQTRQSLDLASLPAWIGPGAILDSEAYCCIETNQPVQRLATLMQDLAHSQDTLLDLRVLRPSLETSFLDLTSTSIPGGQK